MFVAFLVWSVNWICGDAKELQKGVYANEYEFSLGCDENVLKLHNDDDGKTPQIH